MLLSLLSNPVLLEAPLYSELVCGALSAFDAILPSSGEFTFNSLITDAIEITPFLGKAIIADAGFQLQRILYFVVFYKFIKIMPFKF